MWEEEPRWQEAQCRLLVAGVVTFLVVTVGYGVFVRDWELLKSVGGLAGLGMAMLVGYAVVLRVIGEFCRRRWGKNEAKNAEANRIEPGNRH